MVLAAIQFIFYTRKFMGDYLDSLLDRSDFIPNFRFIKGEQSCLGSYRDGEEESFSAFLISGLTRSTTSLISVLLYGRSADESY